MAFATRRLLCRFWLSVAVLAVPMLARGDERVPEQADQAAAVHDPIRELQAAAVRDKKATWGHWGPDSNRYSSWMQHSNRLIPIYTFGMTLEAMKGEKSPYRDSAQLEKLYGYVPAATLNPEAEYFDQTQVYDLQKAAYESGKKYIVLFVFDGMDWQTTWAAAIASTGRVAYRSGRGTGLWFQDYDKAPTDFGYFVTSPLNDDTKYDVDRQAVMPSGEQATGGYDFVRGGAAPWLAGNDPVYLIGRSRGAPKSVTDSASSATSMTCGVKTYNLAINVGPKGEQLTPISRLLQDQGWSIGVVTSVPVSHATPAAAYANNVERHDYQDLFRDLVGLPSVSHRDKPLRGVDVLLGAGWHEDAEKDPHQGQNFVPGDIYAAQADIDAISEAHGGPYAVIQRAANVNAQRALASAARDAAERKKRLFGIFGSPGSPKLGIPGGHLPFQTADGRFDPTAGPVGRSEAYTPEDLAENPTLADMTRAALTVLETNSKGFWLMVEAGDVDWANHDNNIDNSIGAVRSGDAAFRVVTDWAEAHQAWDDMLVIVTADHGHFLVLEQPEALAVPTASAAQ